MKYRRTLALSNKAIFYTYFFVLSSICFRSPFSTAACFPRAFRFNLPQAQLDLALAQTVPELYLEGLGPELGSITDLERPGWKKQSFRSESPDFSSYEDAILVSLEKGEQTFPLAIVAREKKDSRGIYFSLLPGAETVSRP